MGLVHYSLNLIFYSIENSYRNVYQSDKSKYSIVSAPQKTTQNSTVLNFWVLFKKSNINKNSKQAENIFPRSK
ncbi:hypothetical protein Pfo_002253 [Paulownia fortunei]|nr:hypothetical protein Pfo_002253 [Paulownia fortunei]